MRIVVTGGTGFLGRPLCAALTEHDVLVLSPSAAKSALPKHCQGMDVDLNQVADYREALKRFKPELAVHLAWSGLPDYSLAACQRNFQAGLGFFMALAEIGCRRVVAAGTCWEYGPLSGCLGEDRTPETVGQFAAFKTGLRLAGESIFAAAAIDLLWARVFFAYGAAQRTTSLIPTVYQALAADRNPAIQSPAAVNDFIHVDDVASGLVALAISSAPTGIYNLGSGEPTQVCDVVNLVAAAMGRDPPLIAPDQPGQGAWADLTKIKVSVPWRPHIGLREGIERTVAEWRSAS